MLCSIVCAGGTGTRVGGIPKQYRDLVGVSVLRRSVQAMHAAGTRVVVVANDLDAVTRAGVRTGVDGVDAIVRGGDSRRASVACGLAEVPDDATVVAVHDAARPLATTGLVKRVLVALEGWGVDGVVPAVPATDTVKRVDSTGHVRETLDRRSIVYVQTPQAFPAGVLRAAHRDYQGEVTDDASMVEGVGGAVVTVPGDPENLKLTYEFDFEVAAMVLARRGRAVGAST